METKANYVAVGTFVLVCILGLVVALLWLVGAQYSQEYAYYETHFTGAVTGLSKGTTVRYNGIEVGRVTNLQFDPNNPKVVVATMEVDPTLKLHEDSVVSIESQGLAGGSYVEITGGTQATPILKRKPGERYPDIKSKPSSLEALFQGMPELVGRLNVIAKEASDLLNDKNRQSISTTLANLSDITTGVDKRSADIDTTLANLATASNSLKIALYNAESTTKHLDQLSLDTDHLIANNGPELMNETHALVTSLTHLSNQLDREPTRVIFGDRHEGYKPQ